MSFFGSLKGITWNHTCGYAPLVATAQRFEDVTGGVEILWQKRSLKDFGDAPLEKLSEDFDLLVIDHPHIGHAAAREMFAPLENLLSPACLSELTVASVGRSSRELLVGRPFVGVANRCRGAGQFLASRFG